ncbi:Cation efflux system protein CusF precursor [Klebsiella aerogenes]|nr:Cation efflux system protein CusF precursor [Klebsiella aerogenes]
MNSLSKIALFTLLSGVMFTAQAAEPHAGMAMHEQPAGRADAKHRWQRRH